MEDIFLNEAFMMSSFLKIDVWDCKIRSIAIWPPAQAYPTYLDDSIIENQKIVDAAEECVIRQGGAINMSGWYNTDEKFMQEMNEALKDETG